MVQKRVFISWTITDTWSDSLAYHLQANCYHIHFFPINRFRYFFAPFKYIRAAAKTISILRREHPDITLVQNPPPFASLVVWLYCIYTKTKFITDSHSAAFNTTRWKKFLWLYRFLARRALTNIVHNEPIARQNSQDGIPTISLTNIPYRLETDKKYPLNTGFNAVFVNTFAVDEPIEVVLTAAKELPHVNFYITGNLRLAPPDLRLTISPNVILTDYLPDKDYIALLKDCDLVIALTTRDMTMQNGAYEALELGIPIITSDWPVLRNTYTKGAILIDNTAESLIRAVDRMQKKYTCYKKEVRLLREQVHREWNERISELLRLMGSPDESS